VSDNGNPTKTKGKSDVDKSSNFDNAAFIYPNPNNGLFTLLLKFPIQKGEITIYNELGIKIYNTEINNSTKMDFSLSDLKPGIYFLNIISDSNIKPIKFIIMN
jgi:hypothetical protein